MPLTDALLSGGSAVALRAAGQTLTWGELRGRAFALAGALRATRGPVLLYGGKEPEIFCGLCACLLLGRPYLPCAAPMPEARLRGIALRAGAEAAVCAPGLSLPFLRCFDARETSDALPDGLIPAREGGGYRIFTSGSSGEPKGVAVSPENMENFAAWFARLPALRQVRPAVSLNLARLSFDLSVAELTWWLGTGGTLCAVAQAEQADLALLLRRMGESGAGLAVMTPSAAEYCLADPSFGRGLMPELGVIFFCGEPLGERAASRLFARFPGVRILNAYGPTEATCAVCASEIAPETAKNGPLPCGELASAACRAFLEDGEIVLAGKSVARYLDGDPGGFCRRDGQDAFRTGDLGRIREGKLWCLGRRDRQLKVGGVRVAPEEIEAALCRIEGVRAAAVFARRDSRGRVSALTAAAATEKTPAALRAALAERLPDYLLPKVILTAESLPATTNGKLDRKKTEALYGGD